jgi:uncharacterized protein YcbK (DUF882 family)
MSGTLATRRNFLALCGAAAISVTPLAAEAAAPRPPSVRTIALLNPHTGEAIKASYWEKGRYVPEELDAVNYLLRDHWTNEVAEIDPKLLDVLHALQDRLDAKRAFHVMSAYRSPETNDMLRRNGERAAKHSLHMEGKAIDVRMPGRNVKYLHRAAVRLKAGGVGYYPRSNFVHLDVGPVRRW